MGERFNMLCARVVAQRQKSSTFWINNMNKFDLVWFEGHQRKNQFTITNYNIRQMKREKTNFRI